MKRTNAFVIEIDELKIIELLQDEMTGVIKNVGSGVIVDGSEETLECHAVMQIFAGVQLVILGTIGEYLGRLFLDHSRSPQFVVRYLRRREAGDG